MDPMEFLSWDWRLRLDLDVAQRCLFIVCFSYGILFVCNSLPSFLCFWISPWFVELGMTVALVLAVAKSAAQYSPKGKAVLVTGCDTGFGLTLARVLTKIGFTVFAGCLLKDSGGPGSKELLEIGDKNLHVIQLDVTKEEDWDKAVEYIEGKTGGCGGLWGIVNNAGWATFGEVEWCSMDTYRKITEVNLLGLINGVKKVAPLLRRSKGRIVSITSGLARNAVPTRSPYVMTKYASNGFHDCLRYEMEPFGVKVSTIEPGNFIAGTNIFNTKFVEQQADVMWKGMSDEVKDAYGKKYFQERVDIMKGYMTEGIVDISPVIESYTNGLLDVFPQKRYQPMNLYFKTRIFIATHLPEIFFDLIYISYVKREGDNK